MELVQEKYKQTEVGLIPNDWEVKKIKEICTLINGRGFKPFEWKDQGLPIVRIQNLNGSDEYNYFQGHFNPKILINKGQLLFAWSGSKGTSFGPHIWHGGEAVLNYHTWKIKVDEQAIEKNFFLHSLKHLTKQIEDKAHGASALVHTQKGEMENFDFPLPVTKGEQTAIATALNDADALISSIEQLLTKKRNIKQGAMQQLLKPKRGWVVKKLGELCDYINDGSHSTPIYVDNGIPFYSVENVTNNEFRNTKFITKKEHEELIRRCKPEKGDILLTRIGTIGKTKIIDWDVNASIYVSLALLKINSTANPLYLYMYTKSRQFVRDIEERSLMNAIPQKINMGEIKKVPIYVPPTIEEQTKIAIILSDMDAEIAALETKLEKYKMIKQGMMQQLLTGKMRLA